MDGLVMGRRLGTSAASQLIQHDSSDLWPAEAMQQRDGGMEARQKEAIGRQERLQLHRGRLAASGRSVKSGKARQGRKKE